MDVNCALLKTGTLNIETCRVTSTLSAFSLLIGCVDWRPQAATSYHYKPGGEGSWHGAFFV